jgi:hypothetical protein
MTKSQELNVISSGQIQAKDVAVQEASVRLMGRQPFAWGPLSAAMKSPTPFW